MHIVRCLMSLLVVATAASFPDSAGAQGRNVLSAGDVSMRAGPGTRFHKVVTVTGNQIVTVHGCTHAYTWCDVDWAGYRGWLNAKFLRLPGMTGGMSRLAPDLGIPAVDFVAAEYQALHYAVRAEPAGAEPVGRSQAVDESAENLDILGGDIPN